MMQSVNALINNPTGLHARPAALFTKTAAEYQSRITLKNGERVVDAKSIINVLSLGTKQGTSVVITAEGLDEREAIGALVALIESNFGE
ncbi:MAG: putative phosphocarrier protein hpr [Firmicutes bacterium]|nr:putative phosphocarrier protein hpr [Bacillota bacterium]